MNYIVILNIINKMYPPIIRDNKDPPNNTSLIYTDDASNF